MIEFVKIYVREHKSRNFIYLYISIFDSIDNWFISLLVLSRNLLKFVGLRELLFYSMRMDLLCLVWGARGRGIIKHWLGVLVYSLPSGLFCVNNSGVYIFSGKKKINQLNVTRKTRQPKKVNFLSLITES